MKERTTLSGQTIMRITSPINSKTMYDNNISERLTPSGKKHANKATSAASTKLIFFNENKFLKFFIFSPKPQAFSTLYAKNILPYLTGYFKRSY